MSGQKNTLPRTTPSGEFPLVNNSNCYIINKIIIISLAKSNSKAGIWQGIRYSFCLIYFFLGPKFFA